jgi:phage regulator Rha-like protein
MNLTVQNKTMLSTEIAVLSEKEHKNVIRDIEVIIEQLKKDGSDLSSGFKSATYRAGNGKNERCFELDYDSTMIVLTGYNVVARAKVIKRWQELEQNQAVNQPVYSEQLRTEESLRIADFIAQSLRVSESSKLGMFQKVLSLKAPELLPLLPSYAVDAPIDYFTGSSKPTKSLTALLDDNGYKISAVAFNKIALADNFLEKLTRQSSKGMKEFLSITDKGLQYGKNITSPTSPRETQPHWYVDSFKEFAELVLKGE